MGEVDKVLLLASLAGYLLGSVPFGLLLTRLAGLEDLRRIGSGNIGATNVLRTGHKGLALATLVLDSGKGAAVVLFVTWWLDPVSGMIAGLCAVIGHNFPLWLRFEGGKGVSTTLGVFLAAAWPVGLVACGVWLMTALLFRISSLSALAALAAAPIAAYWLATPHHVAVFSVLTLLGWARHHANIRRLLKGEEPRIAFKRKETGGR